MTKKQRFLDFIFGKLGLAGRFQNWVKESTELLKKTFTLITLALFEFQLSNVNEKFCNPKGEELYVLSTCNQVEYRRQCYIPLRSLRKMFISQAK